MSQTLRMSRDGLAYQISENKNGKPILLLHGFMGSSEDWLEAMWDKNDTMHPILLDLPGHGYTRADTRVEWDFATVGSWIVHLLDELGLASPPILAGYSMGGRLALYLAANAPECFSGLILFSASPGLLKPSDRTARFDSDLALATRLQKTPLNDFLESWYEKPLFQSLLSHPQFPDLLQRRQKNDAQLLAKALVGLSTGRQAPLWGALSEIKIPVLLVVGEKDAKFMAIAEKMRELIPGSRVEVIPNAGHNIIFESPQASREAIASLLKMLQ